MKYRPDIVLLVLDTQRADRLSCYGHTAETSPHLDALAADATLFSQAVSTAQWTLPAHASMFTGLYPSQHTMTQLHSALPPALPTLAERLQQAGYFTAAFSNNPLIGAKNNGLPRGFNKILNYSSVDLGLWVSHLEETSDSASSPGSYRQRLRHLLARMLGYGENSAVNWWTSLLRPLLESALKFKGGTKSHNAKNSLAAALDLLVNRREVAPNQPLFVFINLMGTHVPYDPPGWAIEQFVLQAIGKQSTQTLLHQVNMIGLDVNNWLETSLPEAEYRALSSGMYNAEVAAQDAQLGHFFRRLRETGGLDRTLLMVVADHGDHLGEKQRLSHLFGAYQELVRVPLLIRDPAGELPRGQTIDNFVSIRRLFHTALTTAGAATPDEAKLSLVPIPGVTGADDPEHNIAFVEAETPAWVIKRLERQRPGLIRAKGYSRPIRAIYKGDYKLIMKDKQRAELYAVRNDPEESRDLHRDLPEQVEQLQADLQRFILQTRATVTPVRHSEADPALLSRLRDLGYLE